MTVALLRIASDVQRGGIGFKEDWEVIYPGYPTSPPTNSDARMKLMAVVNEWLSHAGATPQLLLHETGSDITFGNRTLFGALALDILRAVSARKGEVLCAECGGLFRPARYLAPGRRYYCEGCGGRKASQRAASRRYRRRQRGNDPAVTPTTDFSRIAPRGEEPAKQ